MAFVGTGLFLWFRVQGLGMPVKGGSGGLTRDFYAVL